MQFSIEKILSSELKTSYDCIQSLCNRSMNVKKLLEQKSTVGLTAVCDLLVTMILAMDAFQRENNKPAVAASNEDSQHSVMPQHEDTVKGEVRLKKEKARTIHAMEIDPTELQNLEEEYEGSKTGTCFVARA